jgi:hypothetical protein
MSINQDYLIGKLLVLPLIKGKSGSGFTYCVVVKTTYNTILRSL